MHVIKILTVNYDTTRQRLNLVRFLIFILVRCHMTCKLRLFHLLQMNFVSYGESPISAVRCLFFLYSLSLIWFRMLSLPFPLKRISFAKTTWDKLKKASSVSKMCLLWSLGTDCAVWHSLPMASQFLFLCDRFQRATQETSFAQLTSRCLRK